MYEARHLHPVAVIIRLAKMVKELIATILIFLVGAPDEYKLYSYLGLAVVIFFIILYSLIAWWKYTYRIEDKEFRLEYGLFIKKKRYVPIERIQTIHVSSGVIQRLFGLVKLQIETAGGSMDAEIELSAIRKKEAEEIQEIIRMEKNSEMFTEQLVDEEEEVAKATSIYRITPSQLLITAATSSGIGVVFSILAFLSQFEEMFTNRFFSSGMDYIDNLFHQSVSVIAFTILLLLLVAWVISIIGSVLKYARFTVNIVDHELMISRGLIEKRTLSVPLERIQAIRIVENPLRQLIGFATVYIDTAGSGNGEGDEGGILFPLIRKQDIDEILVKHLNRSINLPLHPLPKRSLARFYIRNSILACVIVTPIAIFLAPWGLLSLLLLPVAIMLGYFQYRDSGFKVHHPFLTLSYRHISKVTVLLEKKNIQSFYLTTSFWQRRKQLKTIAVHIMHSFYGSTYAVSHMEEKDAEAIYQWLSKSTVYKKKEA